MSAIKLSIIIPIYKVEKYIEKCAYSLMEQTLKDDVEFIFVNDCSPDKSIEILKDVISQYPKRQKQVRIISNEKNLGISDTRKKALSLAKGEYIGWCDSDDWCDGEMFEKMVEMAYHSSSDVVISDYISEHENGDTIEHKHGDASSPIELMCDLIWKDLFPYQLWETLIRRELLIEGFNRIEPTMSGEDCYAIMIALYYAKSVAYIHKSLYHHRILSSSLTSNVVVTKKEWNAQVANIKMIEKLYERTPFIDAALLRWKVFRKKTYINQFDSLWEFYWSFPEVCRTSLKRYRVSLIKRIILTPFYYFYPTYWLLKHKQWKKDKQSLI